MKKIAIAALLSLTAAMSAQAQETAKFRWYGALGMSWGGDTLASGNYTSGTAYAIRAGEGILFQVGMAYQVMDKTDLQLSVGYQTASTTASNGDISFTRNPIELLGFYDVANQWRLGLGLRSSSNAKLSSSGAASNVGSYNFTPSLGQVLEVQYLFDSTRRNKFQPGVSLRVINESYEEKVSKTKINGSSAGLSLFCYF